MNRDDFSVVVFDANCSFFILYIVMRKAGPGN